MKGLEQPHKIEHSGFTAQQQNTSVNDLKHESTETRITKILK